jgi:uncharacterized Ntn-hydrolase superfamily protein
VETAPITPPHGRVGPTVGRDLGGATGLAYHPAMLRHLLACVLAVFACAAPLSATWSIILVNVRTGEIAIASATCLTGLDLARLVPVIVVGKGAAAAQSFVDSTGNNRILLRDQLLLGTDPTQILGLLANSDPGHQTRQYGIVDIRGRAIGFTGTVAGAYASDRVGQFGDIVYAIQGNVLTGGAVLAAAELALFTTPGDMGEKLMAMMDAARDFGGDGRCSCRESAPTACGAPPPGFTKSAHIAFMIVTRGGDTDGICNGSAGCANGSYYMNLNSGGLRETDPDPVDILAQQFAQWKASQVGRPDHLQSLVTPSTATLPVDGLSRARLRVQLRDREGTPIRTGGATVTVALDPRSAGNIGFGPVTDNGDGTYEFDAIAGTRIGRSFIAITVDDGRGPRVLAPAPEVNASTERLWASRSEISWTTGGRIEFGIQPRAPNSGNKLWVLLGSMSGTSPGLIIPPGYRLPLNADLFFQATTLAAFYGIEPGLLGRTLPSGVATTSLMLPPGLYAIPVGTTLSFAYVTLDPITLTSNAVNVRIVP